MVGKSLNGKGEIKLPDNVKKDDFIYIELIKKARIARSDLAISSDFIVGFPGETNKDFEETLEVVKEINFASSYSFKYSPRPGTPASLMKGHVEEETKTNRLQTLQKELNNQQEIFNNSFLGHKLSVLFEKKGKKTNQFVGKSQYLQPVHVISKESIIGEIHDVGIYNKTSHSLHGNLRI